MTDDRSWTDQPEEVIGCPVITNISKSIARQGDWTVQIEVRQAKDGFYLTFGDLFQSQTLHAEDGLAAFLAIEGVSKSEKIPPRCELIRPKLPDIDLDTKISG